MPLLLSGYGGDAAQVGRLYVTVPVFAAIRAGNQSQFNLEVAKLEIKYGSKKGETVLTFGICELVGKQPMSSIIISVLVVTNGGFIGTI